jgi:hypothetical protein
MNRIRDGLFKVAGRAGFSKEIERGVQRELKHTFARLDTLGQMAFRYNLGEAAAMLPQHLPERGLVILGSPKELTDYSKAFSQAQRMLFHSVRRKLPTLTTPTAEVPLLPPSFSSSIGW